MARLQDADQDRFPLPRLDSGRADRAGFGALPRPRATHGYEGRAGMVVILFQIANDGAGSVSRTRHFYSVDEAQEHLASPAWRGFDHASWPRVLRLRQRRFR